jgi:hypothetical protein
VLTTNSPGWQLALPRSQASGALVLSVAPGSPDDKAGITAGDVIVAVDGKPVRNDEQVAVAEKSSGADRRLFTLLAPDGRSRTVEVRPAPPARRISSDYLDRKLATDPDVVTLTLAAQVASDPAKGLDFAQGVVNDVPSFGQAHALVALHSLRLALARPGANAANLPADAAATVLDQIGQAVELDPSSAMIHSEAANIALGLGDSDGAQSEASQAVEIDDNSAQAHYLLGLADLAKHDPAAALPELHKAAALNPYEPTYFEPLVNTYAALGQDDQAARTRQSLELTFNAADPTMSYGNDPASVAIALGMLVGIAALSALVGRYRSSASPSPVLSPEEETTNSTAKQLAIVELLVVIGAWAMATPLSAPMLGVTARGPIVTELFGRFLPGLAVLVVSAFGVRHFYRGSDRRSALGNGIPAALFVFGLWMTGTQVTVVLEAIRSRYPDVAIFRLIPGVSVLVLALWLNLLVVGAQERGLDNGSTPRQPSLPAIG